jgi:flagella basal body P-ring formation protein FlgA
MPKVKIKISRLVCTGLFIVLALVPLYGQAAQLFADQMTLVRLQERVEINGADVLLGQIASIEGSDARFVRKLSEIVIGKAPSPGDARLFDQSVMLKRLKQHQIDLATVKIEAPPQIEIVRAHVEIMKSEIEKIVSGFILKHAPRENTTARIKEMRVPDSVVLSKGHVTYKVSAPRSRQLMGRCPISVEFSVNGRLQKKVWATAVIEVLAPVVITRKPLGRYKPITEDDIEVQTLDLADMPSNVLSDPEAAIGKRTRRAIGALTPLRADSIELPPLVKRGDLVVIIAESETLKITTLGQVKKKGRLGERIPVVNLDSKKVLHAQVIDANTVSVDF